MKTNAKDIFMFATWKRLRFSAVYLESNNLFFHSYETAPAIAIFFDSEFSKYKNGSAIILSQ